MSTVIGETLERAVVAGHPPSREDNEQILKLLQECVERLKVALGCPQIVIIAGSRAFTLGKDAAGKDEHIAHYIDAGDTEVPIEQLYAALANARFNSKLQSMDPIVRDRMKQTMQATAEQGVN